MKLGVITAVTTIFAAALLVTGCGGGSGDSLKLEEYFAEFEAISADADEQINALYADIPDEDIIGTDEELALGQEFLVTFVGVTRDALDRSTTLSPPDPVRDAHNESIDVLEQLTVLLEEVADAVGGAETLAEAEALQAEFQPTIDATFLRLDEACFDLELLAAEHDIVVDLACGDD